MRDDNGVQMNYNEKLVVGENKMTKQIQFTDDNATCMIIGENIFAMLLVEKFFTSFIPTKKICDAKKNTEVLVALSAQSRKPGKSLLDKAV